MRNVLCHKAESFAQRAFGLMHPSAAGYGPYEVLFFDECNSVHTFCMRRLIDVAFLDDKGTVQRVCRDLRPARIRSHRSARAVIERFSYADEWVKAGDRLDLDALRTSRWVDVEAGGGL